MLQSVRFYSRLWKISPRSRLPLVISRHKSDLSNSESFARGLFLGRLKQEQVFPYPEVIDEEAKETLNMLVGPTQKFFEEVNDPVKNDNQSKVPDDIMQGMKELGLFGLQVPTDHNGIGLNNTAYARLVEVVGAHDLGVGITLGAHQSIGFKGILLDGNEQQKAKYLPKLATGEHIAAFCLTEPSSGSDANSIKTRATLSEDGKHFILNGSKIWISNGGLAEIFTVFAQTEVDDPKTGGKKDKVTAFIVERSFGGVSHGPPENKMGIKASNTAEVYFENCKVPIENVLGEVGGGFKVAMRILNNGRFGMGAALTGTMKSCIKIATDHANQRTQFGNKIKDYGLIKEKIAQMAIRLYATESMAYLLSSNMDQGSADYQIEAAISKVFASEAAWFVCDETIQILGGMGFMKDAGVERVMRDLRIFRIFEGTNDILRLFIALTGMQTAGEGLKGIQKALKNPLANFGVLVEELPKRFARQVGFGGSTDKVKHVSSKLKKSAELIEQNTTKFSAAVEALLLKYGKKIMDQQLHLKRIANATMDLYGMAATVARASRAVEKKLDSAEFEVLLAKTFCEEASERISRELSLIKSGYTDSNTVKIADHLFEKEGYDATHPVGFQIFLLTDFNHQHLY